MRRRVKRGNIVTQRLDQCLDELGWGSIEALLGQLHLAGQMPGFEELLEMQRYALSKIRHGGRPCFDYELIAIADALGVNVYWLVGLSDDREPPRGTRKLLADQQ